MIGCDYFPNKTCCAVLSSRYNHILLALAAVEGWFIYQADIVQAFLHGQLDDVRIISIRSVGAVCGWSGDSMIGWMLSIARGRLGMGGVGDAWAGWRLSVARAGASANPGAIIVPKNLK